MKTFLWLMAFFALVVLLVVLFCKCSTQRAVRSSQDVRMGAYIQVRVERSVEVKDSTKQ